MIGFFPQLIEGESLYGLITRYHQQARHESPKQTLRELFGTDSAIVSLDLPGRIDALISRIDSTSLKAGELIERHTLFPLYSAFMTKPRAEELKRMLRRRDYAGSVHTSTGLMASSVRTPRELKACPTCFASGLETWMVLPQLAGLLACPAHGVKLLFLPRHKYSRNGFVPLTKGLLRLMRPCCSGRSLGAKDLKLARMAQSIQDVGFAASGAWSDTNRYLESMRYRHYVTRAGSLRWKRIVPDFNTFWGADLLRELNAELPLDRYCHWLARLFDRSDTYQHPIHHLLLMGFLGLTGEEPPIQVLEASFGKPPWPCLNPVCPDYRRLVIGRVDVSTASDGTRCVGRFLHDCGYEYRRFGPDVQRRAIFDKQQTLRFGEAWEAECLKLARDPQISWREAGRLLGVDVATVQQRLRTHAAEPVPSPTTETARLEWIELQATNPAISRTELRALSPALYAALYRRDREWLLDHAPEKRPAGRPGRCVDWLQRDRDLSRRVRPIVREIKAFSSPLQRASRAEIGRRLGASSLIEQHLDRLPATGRLLNRHAETPAAYRQRRVVAAYKRLLKTGHNPTLSELMYAARIRPCFADEITLLPKILGDMGWRVFISKAGDNRS